MSRFSGFYISDPSLKFEVTQKQNEEDEDEEEVTEWQSPYINP